MLLRHDSISNTIRLKLPYRNPLIAIFLLNYYFFNANF